MIKTYIAGGVLQVIVLIVGRGGIILRSGDGGRTWVEQESTTKQNLFALFINKKNGWAVGADGLILRYER